MHVKDFWIPCSFEEREPLLLDQLLFIPEHYNAHEEFSFPLWSDSRIFGNDHPVVVEYCSGNGQWIVEKAQQEPHKNWVAVEKRFDRVRKIWVKQKKADLSNVFVVFGDAVIFSKFYVSENSIDASYMNFPDPWPKTKHAKHRIVQKDFVKDLSRILKAKARATFVTDNESYSKQIIDTFLQSPFWISAIDFPFYTDHWPDFGTSYFDRLWRDKGLAIRYHQFINQKLG